MYQLHLLLRTLQGRYLYTYLKTGKVEFMEILEPANDWIVNASVGIQTQIQLLGVKLLATAFTVFLKSQRE